MQISQRCGAINNCCELETGGLMSRNRACRRSTIITGIGAGKVEVLSLSIAFNSCRRLGPVLD